MYLRRRREEKEADTGNTDGIPAVVLDCGAVETLIVPYEERKEKERAEALGADDRISELSDADLAALCVGRIREGHNMVEIVGNASETIAGAAGETTNALEHLGIPALVMADGPAGLRLSPAYRDTEQGVIPLQEAVVLDFAKKRQREALPTGEDVCYQFCTAVPIGAALAQSWNDELARMCGDLVGGEMERFGVQLWLAPALNIQRSPLCGRNFEYYSEDPLLSGRMAAHITLGVQSHLGCSVTIKHFACNNQETDRYFSDSVLDERTLREIYLKGFEICVRMANPGAVMTSYNLINGVHTCNRQDLLTDVLRGEWGFNGIVMTDWEVTSEALDVEGKCGRASAAGCVKAGNDLIMPGAKADIDDILDALAHPEHPYHLTRRELEACAGRMLRFIQLTGNGGADH